MYIRSVAVQCSPLVNKATTLSPPQIYINASVIYQKAGPARDKTLNIG